MYSTCIYCTGSLGTNEALEIFPVGRRVAFDAARGRLWVVCRRCERWNLAPIEERWEAIEAAERAFRDTRMRASTGEIGLARTAEGLELVRIGAPQRPEFAAWRYGDQFGRRRRRAVLVGGAGAALVTTVAAAGMTTGIVSAAILFHSDVLFSFWRNGRTLVRVRTDDGAVLRLKRPDLWSTRLRPDSDGHTMVLEVCGRRGGRSLRGAEAQRIASVLIARMNAKGARGPVVQRAIRSIDSAGGPDGYLARLMSLAASRRGRWLDEPGAIEFGKLEAPGRLAVEMALHEEQERRALEGELKGLSHAWQEAEEVAAIADDLLLPEHVRRKLGRERRTGD